MGVFGAFFGCIGDGGFNGCWSGACSGDGGFMLACISGCRGVIGCKVATGGVLCAKKFALLDLMCVRARNSSPCSLITPQIRHFCACRASIFAETRLEERCWASIFAEMPLGARCWASFFAIQQS